MIGGCEAEDVGGDPSRAGLGSAAPLRGVLVGVGRLFGILGGDGVAPKLLPLMLPAKGDAEAEAEAFGSKAPPLAAGFDGGRFAGTVNAFFIGGILFGEAGEPGAAPSALNPGRIGGAFPAKGGGEDIAFVSSIGDDAFL